MNRHSIHIQGGGRPSGIRGALLGFGLVLAVLTGLFTFFVGVMGWFAFSLLRLITSPFRSTRKGGRVRPDGAAGARRRTRSGSGSFGSEPRLRKTDTRRAQNSSTSPSGQGRQAESSRTRPDQGLKDAVDVEFEEIP